MCICELRDGISDYIKDLMEKVPEEQKSELANYIAF